jgi:hypothetical protein
MGSTISQHRISCGLQQSTASNATLLAFAAAKLHRLLFTRLRGMVVQCNASQLDGARRVVLYSSTVVCCCGIATGLLGCPVHVFSSWNVTATGVGHLLCRGATAAAAHPK